MKDYEYYLVFMDDRSNFLTAYGYDHKPAIIEFKYALEALQNDKEVNSLIPNLMEIFDYICFETMTNKKFVKYMKKQEIFSELFADKEPK